MKLVAPKENLVPALARVAGATERKPSVPGPGQVILESTGEHRLTARANDGEVSWEVVVEPVIIDADFRVAVNAKMLLDVIRQAPAEAEVDMTMDSDRLMVRYGRSRFALGTFPIDQVSAWEHAPEVLEAVPIALPAGVFRKLIESSAFAMAHNDVRFYLQGLLLAGDGRSLRAVATDGHRLAMIDHTVEGVESSVDAWSGIIPRKAVAECVRNLGSDDSEVKLRIGQREAQFEIGSDRLSCRLIEGKYPDYERVLPPPANETIVIDAGSLARAIQRVVVVASERTRSIRVEFSQKGCSVRSASAEREEAEEWVDAEFGGEPIEVGFNPQYLLDVLQVAGSESVRLQVRDSASSVRIETPAAPRAVYVVMPIRL